MTRSPQHESKHVSVWKRVARALLVFVLSLLLFLGWKLATGNFATVLRGRVYRSGQMGAQALGSHVRDHKIRTVLNLRGSHPEEAWYRQERAEVLAQGATQIDVAMSSCEWMSRAQARAVVNVLNTCEYPVLIHCWRGAERTGLISAFTELLRPDGSLRSARGQFSIVHLFLPLGDGAIMPEHLDRYEDWLKERGLNHTPSEFKRWVAEGFQPGQPSRENWPYDPYPLVVVTRPQASAEMQTVAGRQQNEPSAAPRLTR
jgi:protein tyrosine phosphatase (PTP) superfamily phosphohydrolase (DUF442 family)